MGIETQAYSEQQSPSQKTEGFVAVRENSSEPTIKNNIRMVLLKGAIMDDQLTKPASTAIYQAIREQNISPTGLDTIGGHIIVYYTDDSGNEQYKVFQVNIREESVFVTGVNFEIGTLWQIAHHNERESIERVSHGLQELEIVLNAMETVFENNTSWIARWGTLDEDDTYFPDTNVSPWKDIKDLPNECSLVYLQKLAESMMADIKIDTQKLPKDAVKENRKKLAEYSEKYIEFVMGIGQKYEGGAALFKDEASGQADNPETKHDESIQNNVSEEKIFELLDFMIENKSIDELLLYMVNAHYKIDLNDYQSTEVERSYEAWRHKVHSAVLHKMKDENVEDQYFLQYSRIVTGRESRYVQNVDPSDAGGWITNSRIDNDYKDTEAAQDALLYVCNRENGIITKIQTDPESNFVVEDPEMRNFSPFDVVNMATDAIHRKVEGLGENANSGNIFLRDIGFGNIVNTISPETPYHDLNLEEKMKIAILLRASQKLNRQRNPVDTTKLGDIFIDATKDGQQVLIDSFEDNFDDGWFSTKSAEDFNLTGVDSEIFELYMDIQGVGLWDLADSTKGDLGELAKMGAMFAAAFGSFIVIGAAATAAGVVLSPLIVAGIAGASMAGISQIIYPKGYENYSDMALDMGSDAIVGGATGMGSVALAGKLGNFGQGLTFAGADLGAGLSIEVVRNWQVEAQLYGKDRYSLPEFHEFIKLKSKELRAMQGTHI